MSYSPIATKRIIRDVTNVMSTSAATLATAGIYYKADESNVYHGTALLVGPADTPYFGGYYFFSVDFPEDYPFAPIKVKSLTQDGATRFNPNMYVDGKVCLSILNTWHDGPQWSGVQSLESVLLVIMSDVLHGNPIINEPAYRSFKVDNPDSIVYNRIIWHSNLLTAIYEMMTRPPRFAKEFNEIIKEHFLKNYDALIAKATESTSVDGTTETSRIYRMVIKYNFGNLVEKLKSLKS